MAHGAFGSIRWATMDGGQSWFDKWETMDAGQSWWATMDAGLRCVAKCATSKKLHADEFLRVEAGLNARLSRRAPGSRHLAPFLGVASVAGVDYCLWAACPGADETLQQYLEPTPRLPALARALGVVGADIDLLSEDEERALFRKLLKEILEAVALINLHGVVHRDIKPENVLVDTRTHSLRLIDFGAARAIDTPDTVMLLASGENRDASFKATRAAGSRIYMPPERSHTATMTYDVYSVAMVWLRALAPSLASKSMLDEFRTVVASEHQHLIEEWLDHGFELHADDHRLFDFERTTGPCVFSGDAGEREGKLAWRLLRAMMDPDPKERVTAAEALAGPYLGGCAGIDAAADTTVPACTEDYSCYIPGHQATERSVEECELDDEVLEAERHTIA